MFSQLSIMALTTISEENIDTQKTGILWRTFQRTPLPSLISIGSVISVKKNFKRKSWYHGFIDLRFAN